MLAEVASKAPSKYDTDQRSVSVNNGEASLDPVENHCSVNSHLCCSVIHSSELGVTEEFINSR